MLVEYLAGGQPDPGLGGSMGLWGLLVIPFGVLVVFLVGSLIQRGESRAQEKRRWQVDRPPPTKEEYDRLVISLARERRDEETGVLGLNPSECVVVVDKNGFPQEVYTQKWWANASQELRDVSLRYGSTVDPSTLKW